MSEKNCCMVMYIEQLYTNCLAEAAYYIESEGEAVIIDPIRETDAYIQLAASRGAAIKYVLETHFHADFVSGHIDLATATGAEIVFGPGAETEYPVHHAADGEVLQVGKLRIEVRHTPGHTPESTCYLLYDEAGKAHALFSGDTLFVGDVGRPDLLDGKMTKEALAGMMYDSLWTKILALPDEVLVYPAHGPGSACGKNIGKETWSTIGQQKRSNYALQPMSREEFVAKLTAGLAAPPQYYFKDAAINKQGYSPLADVLLKNIRSVSLAELDTAMTAGALVLDVRPPEEFEAGHVPNSMNIGLDGTYAWWAGTLIDIATPLVIIAPAGREEEAVRRLARIGYENVLGYMSGGFETWAKAGRPVSLTSSIDPSEFPARRAEGLRVLDVRNVGEFENGHIEGALNIPIGALESRLSEIDSSQEYLVHCAGGYRSMIAASILERQGFEHVENVRGGFSKMKSYCQDLIVTPREAMA
jgi:glyoxylase-like metal-dependent hydrolase (beta-lactamase superfamily II)/rhodanese-related sulfurtransferase